MFERLERLVIRMLKEYRNEEMHGFYNQIISNIPEASRPSLRCRFPMFERFERLVIRMLKDDGSSHKGHGTRGQGQQAQTEAKRGSLKSMGLLHLFHLHQNLLVYLDFRNK